MYYNTTNENKKKENCPKFILQHSHIYTITGEMFSFRVEIKLELELEAFSQRLLRSIAFSLQTQAHIAHWQTTPTFIFIFSLTFLFVFFMHIFNLLESYVMVYQAHILSKTINSCQSQIYKFGYLFFFRLMDFSYEIVMAIYIEEVIRG